MAACSTTTPPFKARRTLGCSSPSNHKCSSCFVRARMNSVLLRVKYGTGFSCTQCFSLAESPCRPCSTCVHRVVSLGRVLRQRLDYKSRLELGGGSPSSSPLSDPGYRLFFAVSLFCPAGAVVRVVRRRSVISGDYDASVQLARGSEPRSSCGCYLDL